MTDDRKCSITVEERSIIVNVLGNCEGAMTVLLIADSHFTDSQKQFLTELKSKIAAAADILINSEIGPARHKL